MTIRTTLAGAALAAALAAGASAQGYDPQDPAKADWLTLIDVFAVSSEEEALEHARWVKPLADVHGALLIQAYDVTAVQAGDPAFEWVYLFRSPDEETFVALLDDPEHAANIPERNRIHDFDTVTRLVLRPVYLAGE